MDDRRRKLGATPPVVQITWERGLAMEWLDGMLALLVGMTGVTVFGVVVLWTAPLGDEDLVCPGMGPECVVCGGEAKQLANVAPPRCWDCEYDLGGE